MGRYCILCHCIRPNEAFGGGRSERARICRRCRQIPSTQRQAMLHEGEIQGFLEQSRISAKNVARLRTLAQSENGRIADLAAVALEVALLRPGRRSRLTYLARERRDLIGRMEAAGLIPPRLECDDEWLCDVDPADVRDV
jgi:hypothetical protein